MSPNLPASICAVGLGLAYIWRKRLASRRMTHELRAPYKTPHGLLIASAGLLFFAFVVYPSVNKYHSNMLHILNDPLAYVYDEVYYVPHNAPLSRLCRFITTGVRWFG